MHHSKNQNNQQRLKSKSFNVGYNQATNQTKTMKNYFKASNGSQKNTLWSTSIQSTEKSLDISAESLQLQVNKNGRNIVGIQRFYQQTKPTQKMAEIQNPQRTFFMENQVAYVKFLKGVFILEQIIDTIEKQNILGMNKILEVEFMFLVASRVKNYLLSARKLMEKEKDKSKELQCLFQDFKAYEEKALSKYRVYDKMVNKNSRGIRLLVMQKIPILFGVVKDIQGKDIFLDGFENIDFKQREQVQFTYENYIEVVLNSKQMLDKHFKNHRLRKILKSYSKICGIDPSQIHSQNQFRIRLNQIVISQ